MKKATKRTSMRTEELLEKVRNILKDGGVEEESDSEWIVSITTGLKRSELFVNDAIQPLSVVDDAVKMAEKRAGGMPLWQVVGNTDFYGYKINVSGDVLTPRPETEELCEWIIRYAKKEDKILDLCTGSGAIAITLKKKTGAKVTASDISEKALATAKENAKENNAEIEFIESDMFEKIEGTYSIIVSNPPYIPSADIAHLDREVKDYEPLTALDGGKDGLDFYRIIAKESRNYLAEKGHLYMEVGINQAEDVKELLIKSGFTDVEIKKDISGIERMIKAEK